METQIAAFYTQPGRVFEHRDDFKADSVEVNVSHGDLIARVHKTRPDVLPAYIAKVG